MTNVIPVWLAQAVLIAAPLILGLSVAAHLRLRRHMYASPEPIASFRNFRWNSGLIAVGGVFLFREAAGVQGLGGLAQVCGFLLSLEFFYVAYANVQVVMSPRGLLLGMNFTPWRRFAGYAWLSEENLELRSRREKRYRLQVPEEMRAVVTKILDQNILR